MIFFHSKVSQRLKGYRKVPLQLLLFLIASVSLQFCFVGVYADSSLLLVEQSGSFLHEWDHHRPDVQ